jgi:hypothetical protein
VLKDRFDTPPEPDEPHQNDVDHDHDELYDDDQFYKEPEAVPPEPKVQGDLAKERGSDIIPSIITVQSSSVRPPMRTRDESTLEGECALLGVTRRAARVREKLSGRKTLSPLCKNSDIMQILCHPRERV